MARPSSQSTSSTVWNRPCCVLCNARPPPLPACAAPISARTSPTFRPLPSPDTSAACASSACLNASTAPIATTSPKSGAPPSQPVPISPRTFSFPPSHDKIFAQNVKSRSTRAYRLHREPEPLADLRLHGLEIRPELRLLQHQRHHDGGADVAAFPVGRVGDAGHDAPLAVLPAAGVERHLLLRHHDGEQHGSLGAERAV